LQFNTLLREAHIDPASVKLARHQDNRFSLTPFSIWQANDGRFERYQSTQRREVFSGCDMIASFVVTPFDETLFVGIYEVGSVGTIPGGTEDPIAGPIVGDHFLYQLTLSSKLADYGARIVIDWGTGFRSWVQRAAKQDKPVLEIRRKASEERFPGFTSFRRELNSLASVPPDWRTILSAVKGVYLLVDLKNGKQYVGSAQGSEGFWTRWEQYVSSGHGGNRRMMDVPNSEYQVTILEVASSSASDEDILRSEHEWKEKLMSRKFGLNAN
jgi:hypothetical protein